MKILQFIFVLALTFPATPWNRSNLSAEIIWNEAVNGDLSSAPASPSALTFSNGSNIVIGSLSVPAGDLRDFMTFTIGPGQSLTGLTLDTFIADGAGFQGLNSGSIGLIPGVAPARNFLGLEFVITDFVGTNMLVPLSESADAYGSAGFSIPLGPGTYSYVIQEITPGQASSYQLNFSVVPEPSSIWLVSLVLSMAAVRRRVRI